MSPLRPPGSALYVIFAASVVNMSYHRHNGAHGERQASVEGRQGGGGRAGWRPWQPHSRINESGGSTPVRPVPTACVPPRRTAPLPAVIGNGPTGSGSCARPVCPEGQACSNERSPSPITADMEITCPCHRTQNCGVAQSHHRLVHTCSLLPPNVCHLGNPYHIVVKACIVDTTGRVVGGGGLVGGMGMAWGWGSPFLPLPPPSS